VRWQRLGLPYIGGSVGYITAVLIDALGSGLFLPLSLLYFQAVAGLPLSSVGLTLTAATLLTLPTTPATGILVDTFGAKRVLVASQLLQGAGFCGYLFVRTIPTLAITTVLITVGTRMFYTANATLVAEIAVPDERDRWYGLVGALRNAGIGVGSVFAGVMIALGSRTGYQLIVGANAVSFLIAAILLVQVRTNPRRQRPQATTGRQGYGVVLRDWPYMGFVVSNLALVVCSMVASIALPIFVLEALAAPRWTVGALSAFTTIFAVVGQPLIIRLIERRRRTRALAAAGIVRGCASALFALALLIPRPVLVPYLVVVATLLTVGGMLHTPVAAALAADAGPVALRGRYLAVVEFSWGLAAALAPAMFTVLYAVGTAVPWFVMAGLAIATVAPTLLLERRLPPQAVRRRYHISPFRPTIAQPSIK